jgi:hypothetical protein
MKKTRNLIFLMTIMSAQLFSVHIFAAIETKKNISTNDAKSDIEKLTGLSQKINSKTKALNPQDQALLLARQSRDQKNYIQAIKRYNYIIKNFSNSKQAVAALSDKAAIYNKMGFEKPASYNLTKAKMLSTSKMQSGSLKK